MKMMERLVIFQQYLARHSTDYSPERTKKLIQKQQSAFTCQRMLLKNPVNAEHLARSIEQYRTGQIEEHSLIND